MEVRQTLGGRYKLLNELGTGGMAVVWRARDEVLGRPVAVKVLAGRYSGDPQSRARIRDEARAAANLSHPNIAQVYDYGEADDRPYVVMELINGPTLQQRVASAPLPPRTVFRICGEVAAALAAAHAEGLVHRDIKMANIMVTSGGAKVVDFGIAAVAGPAAPEEMLVGTPAYLAPERLTGDVVQPASDVYALGVLLYRLLADESPWSVESTTQMLKAHVYVEPAPLPPLPGVPTAVVNLISGCLRKDPQARPTASRVSSILADAAEALPEVRGKAAAAGGRRGAGAAAGVGALASIHGVEAPPADDLHAETGLLALDRGRGTNDRDRAADARRPGNQREAADAEVRSPDNRRDANGANRGGGGRGAAGAPGAGALGAGALGAAASNAAGSNAAGSNFAASNVGVFTRPARPAHAPGGAGGSEPPQRAGVRLTQRKALLAAGIAMVTAAALTAWLWIGDNAPNRPDAATGTTTSAAPAQSDGGLGAPPATRTAAVDPAATDLPGRGAIIGNGPVPSQNPSAPTGTSGGVSQAPPEPTASTGTSESPPAAPDGKRLTSPGGVVYAACAQGKATLNDWAPADGYTVEKVVAGPALAPQIIFKGPKNRYRMTVTCVAGTPTPVVLPL
ncbi:MAG: serine/threonine-protein kinase [Actinoplanes sp.]